MSVRVKLHPTSGREEDVSVQIVVGGATFLYSGKEVRHVWFTDNPDFHISIRQNGNFCEVDDTECKKSWSVVVLGEKGWLDVSATPMNQCGYQCFISSEEVYLSLKTIWQVFEPEEAINISRPFLPPNHDVISARELVTVHLGRTCTFCQYVPGLERLKSWQDDREGTVLVDEVKEEEKRAEEQRESPFMALCDNLKGRE